MTYASVFDDDRVVDGPATKLAHALAAAAADLWVFPLLPNRKTPPKDMHFKELATREESQIRKWWTDNPDYNIGVYAGRYADDAALLILDPDQTKGKNGLAELERLKGEGFDLPATRTTATPTGGRHLYFRVPRAARQGTSVIAPGVDVRSAGGYVVGPGSTIDGKPYADLGGGIAEAPAWLIECCGQPRQKSKSDKPAPTTTCDDIRRRGREWLATHPPAIEGQGGDAMTFKVGCRLRDFGYARADAHADMLERWNDRCAPPWGPDDLWQKVCNVYEYGQNEPGCADPKQEFEPWHGDGWSTLRSIRRQTPKDGEHLVPGLIERGVVTCLDGPGGSHKSRLALQLAIGIDAGAHMLGVQLTKCPSVYLSSEDGPDEIVRRTTAIANVLGIPEDDGVSAVWDRVGRDSYIVEAAEGGVIKMLPFHAELVSRLKGISGHKFVVLDSAFDFIRYKGSAKIDEGAVNAVYKQVLTEICRECNCTILVIRHPSRSGITDGTQEGWSVANTNSIRSRLSLAPKANTQDCYILRREKANHGPAGKHWELFYSGGALVMREGLADVDQRERGYRAVIKVAIESKDPMTKQKNPLPWHIEKIKEECGATLSVKEIKNYLSLAVQTGKLRYQDGHGKNKAGYFGPLRPVETAVETGLKPEVETG